MNTASKPRAVALEILRCPGSRPQALWMEVKGNSMLPTLRPGDRVEVEGVEPARLRFGDLAVLETGDAGWVIHRFFGWRRRAPGQLLTKGDARTYFDPEWRGSGLIGRVRSIEREGRRWTCNRTWLVRGAVRSILVWLAARIFRRQPAEGGL